MSAAEPSIGVDIGGTNLRAALVDSEGVILASESHALRERSPEYVCLAISEAIAHLGEEADGLPLGVALAAQMNRQEEILVAPNLGWRGLDLKPQLEATLRRQVRLANDLDAAAWGEACCGAGKGIPLCEKNLFLLFVGSGVGGALVLDGALYRGASGVTGEIGHIKVGGEGLDEGRLCGCGERACLEAYAGGHALGRRAKELLDCHHELLLDPQSHPALASLALDPGLVRLSARLQAVGDPARENPTKLDARLFLEEAASSEGALRVLALEAATLLAQATANLVSVLSPAQLLLGGGVLLGSPWFFKEVEDRIRAQLRAPRHSSLSIKAPELGDRAGLIGAALLARA